MEGAGEKASWAVTRGVDTVEGFVGARALAAPAPSRSAGLRSSSARPRGGVCVAPSGFLLRGLLQGGKSQVVLVWFLQLRKRGEICWCVTVLNLPVGVHPPAG